MFWRVPPSARWCYDRNFARAFLLTGTDGLAYLRNYGPAVHTRWAQYQQRMNALRLSAEEREQMIQSANEFFAQLEAIFQALYPFQPESKTFLVTSINPEAGRHPVPADAREVQASLRAADLCWQRFPYFEHRYGERGRRFARSDAAWQATLCQYEPAQIIKQVRWLGRVLAGRGMPTFLLQDQLEILVAELAAAIPGKNPNMKSFWRAPPNCASRGAGIWPMTSFKSSPPGSIRPWDRSGARGFPAPGTCSSPPWPMSWKDAKARSRVSVHG